MKGKQKDKAIFAVNVLTWPRTYKVNHSWLAEYLAHSTVEDVS